MEHQAPTKFRHSHPTAFRHHLATVTLSGGSEVFSVVRQDGWRIIDIMLGVSHDVSEKQ